MPKGTSYLVINICIFQRIMKKQNTNITLGGLGVQSAIKWTTLSCWSHRVFIQVIFAKRYQQKIPTNNLVENTGKNHITQLFFTINGYHIGFYTVV